MKEGIQRFGKYFRRKGWLGEEGSKREGSWRVGEGGVRVVVEVATAWALVKMLLPLRIVFSVWGTPWFARACVLPMTGWIGRLFGIGKGKRPVASGAGGTGAVEGGVVQKLKNEGPLYKGSNGGSKPDTSGVKNDGPLYKNAKQSKPD